eukprot:1101561-Alexandrium_andersonii.AAC.1
MMARARDPRGLEPGRCARRALSGGRCIGQQSAFPFPSQETETLIEGRARMGPQPVLPFPSLGGNRSNGWWPSAHSRTSMLTLSPELGLVGFRVSSH